MKIKVLFFGITTDLSGEKSLEIDIIKNGNIGDLKIALKKRYPSLVHLNEYAIALNETYASDIDILKTNDTVAIIPPVSGG